MREKSNLIKRNADTITCNRGAEMKSTHTVGHVKTPLPPYAQHIDKVYIYR